MSEVASRRPPVVVDLLVLLVRVYQRLISPLFPASCRYVPSCSEYAAQALRRHGMVRGLWLAARRIVRCHPWAEGGDDPVPDRNADEPPRFVGR
jgi:putative membrane protein insertion efficiency factor